MNIEELRQENKEVVFDKYWFNKHQSKLVWLFNSFLGQKLFRLKEKIVKITPNSFVVKKDELFIETFYKKNVFSKKLYFCLLPLWNLMHLWDKIANLIKQPQLNFGFDTLTQYPGSIGTDNPLDGFVLRSGVDQTFTNIRAGAGTGSAISGGSIYVEIYSSATSNQFVQLQRGLIYFDTSSLTSDAVISGATFSVYGSNKWSGFDAAPTLHIASGNSASTSELANSDYAQSNFGTTSFGSIAYADFTIDFSGYNVITLNSSGLSAISKTGITKFSAQLGWDLNNNFTPTWAANKEGGFLLYSANNSGTSADPKLVVTYTIPAPAQAGFLFNMI